MKTKTFKLTFLAGAISTVFSSCTYAEIGTSITDKINAAQNGGNNVVKVIEAGMTLTDINAMPDDNEKKLYLTNKGTINIDAYISSDETKAADIGYSGVYVKNEENARIDNTIYIPAMTTEFELENNGSVENIGRVILQESKILKTFKAMDRTLKIKNGISGSIKQLSDTYNHIEAKLIEIENKGEIDQIVLNDSYDAGLNDTTPNLSENISIINDGNIKEWLVYRAFNASLQNNGSINWLKASTAKGEIINKGKIKRLIIERITERIPYYRDDELDSKFSFDVGSSGTYLANKVLRTILENAADQDYAQNLNWSSIISEEEAKTALARLLGIPENEVEDRFDEMLIAANKEVMEKYGEIEVHLEDGEVGSVEIDRRDAYRDSFKPDTTEVIMREKSFTDKLRSEPVKIYVNKNTKITDKIETKGEDDTIVLVGTTDIDNNKFKGFTNLVVTKADWTLSDKDFKYSNTVKIEDSTVHLNKSSQVGNIESGTITNDKNSLILVETDYELNGDVVNEGKIHFVPDPNLAEDDANKNEPHTLTINGNYSGEGTIKMRVNVEKSPITNDKVMISETATGKTKIELANDPVGLKVRTKEKATLIEAKAEGSQANAFKLGRSRFGPYRYLLSSLKEDDKIKWILEQRFSGEIGNIVTALSNSQQLFTHTYYDRTGAAKNDQGVWVRLGHQRKESQIGGSDSTITSNSTLSHLQIGYDIDRFAFKNGQLSYGAYVNYGTDKTKTQFIGEPEIARSKLKGYGVGFYSSYLQDNWYLDSWLSYNKFSNKLFTEEGINKYDMKALQASAELGYQYNIPVGSQQLAIKPQWQLIYTYIPNFDVAGFDGLKAENRHYLTSRLGVRLNLETAYQFKPFVELNWIYNMKETAINLEDEKFKLEGNRHLKEVKVGFERLGLTKNTYLWGQVLGRFGTDKYREYAVQAGISYQF